MIVFFFLNGKFFFKVRGGLQERLNLSSDSDNDYNFSTIKNISPRSNSVTKSNRSNFSTPSSIASTVDQPSWLDKIPNRHSPNFIMSDGSYDSPTQKYLDSHSSSPLNSPKSIGNSQSNSPIAIDDGNIKNNNYQNNAFSPGLSNINRSQISSRTKNLTPSKNSATSSYKYSRNNNNFGKLPEIEEEESVSDDPTENNGFNSNKTVSPYEIDIKLNQSETNLSKEFSRNLSNLFTPQTQKNEIQLLSDSESENSSFHQKNGNFSYQMSSGNHIAYLSESETNESEVSSSGLNRKVTSYINHIKYLNSSELETSSTSSANVLTKSKFSKRNVNLNLDSETETFSEESSSSKFKKTARRQNNSYRPNTNSNISIDSDSETTEESVTNLTKNSFNKGISGLHLSSDSELNSEDSSSNKHYENLTRNNTKSTYTISKINLNSDSETNSESSLNFNYKTKSPTQNDRFNTNSNSDSSDEFSNKKKSNDLDLNFNYNKSPSLNQQTTTPIARNFSKNQDSSSEAFIETPKFPISKRNESALASDSSEEFNPIRSNYSSSITPKPFNRYSSPKNSSFQDANNDATSYSFQKSNNFVSQQISRTPNTSSSISNKKAFKPSSSAISQRISRSPNTSSSISNKKTYQPNSFISNNSNILENDADTDSDDEFLATLKQAIEDNEALLRSFGHAT